ncbi:HK97 gp10 family phage protein [Desulfovibrio porci]|uniref:HK97 gp10 family phage protein n=1 Tax=Desulfovibrio porci TaxID=2605782 RepID=UPI003A900841
MSRHPHSSRLEGFDDDELTTFVRAHVEPELEDIANRIAVEAIASTEFEDSPKTKNKLRKSIRAKASRFKDGGWIVLARAPHAHLVEYGHAMVTHDGRTVGHVTAHPFMRKARNKVLLEVIAEFRSKYGEGSV